MSEEASGKGVQPAGHVVAPAAARALIVHPAVRQRDGGTTDHEARLEEAVGLARAIDLEVVASHVLPLQRITPSTFIGSGGVKDLKDVVGEAGADLVVMDCTLSPGQQRNLERGLGCKVIDRTALILEIFGARARTSEGRLQVELAHLTYQRSRLVRSWTHLERQRGGRGFMGGPGEAQIEIDRRLIDERITRLKGELETVRKRRALQRKARRAVPYPVVALVGYTNAGKSTLFNRLTGAEVLAKDMLFATLDPTMRGIRLPSGQRVILSDTVGFISDLPTQLVAAFRATLEEVEGADVIVHVRDVSRPDTDDQAESVLGVLRDMGLDDRIENGLFEVLNKIDRLDETARAALRERAAGRPRLAVSALTGEGIDTFLSALDEEIGRGRHLVDVSVRLTDGAGIAWLYRHGDVVERTDDEDLAHIRVALSPADIGRFEARHEHPEETAEPVSRSA